MECFDIVIRPTCEVLFNKVIKDSFVVRTVSREA